MNTLSKIALSIAIALSIIAIVIAVRPATQNLGALQTTGENSFYGVTVNGVVSASTTASTLVLSANNTRQYARITNVSANGIYLGLGTTSVFGSGILLAAGANYEINPLNSFKGAIYAIATSSASNLAVTEK